MQERKTMRNALPSPASLLGTFILEIGTALVIFAAVITSFAAIFS